MAWKSFVKCQTEILVWLLIMVAEGPTPAHTATFVNTGCHFNSAYYRHIPLGTKIQRMVEICVYCLLSSEWKTLMDSTISSISFGHSLYVHLFTSWHLKKHSWAIVLNLICSRKGMCLQLVSPWFLLLCLYLCHLLRLTALNTPWHVILTNIKICIDQTYTPQYINSHCGL